MYTPPPEFQTWLDYAIATMDLRGAQLGNTFNGNDASTHDNIMTAALEELDELRRKATMPWVGILENWQKALSKRLGRSAYDIVENNLRATDFSDESVLI